MNDFMADRLSVARTLLPALLSRRSAGDYGVSRSHRQTTRRRRTDRKIQKASPSGAVALAQLARCEWYWAVWFPCQSIRSSAGCLVLRKRLRIVTVLNACWYYPVTAAVLIQPLSTNHTLSVVPTDRAKKQHRESV